MKKCIACGMPMHKLADFAGGDENKDYCVHCANQDGSMQPYEVKLNNLTDFIIKTQGFDREMAYTAAKSMMGKLPAWKDCIDN